MYQLHLSNVKIEHSVCLHLSNYFPGQNYQLSNSCFRSFLSAINCHTGYTVVRDAIIFRYNCTFYSDQVVGAMSSQNCWLIIRWLVVSWIKEGPKSIYSNYKIIGKIILLSIFNDIQSFLMNRFFCGICFNYIFVPIIYLYLMRLSNNCLYVNYYHYQTPN